MQKTEQERGQEDVRFEFTWALRMVFDIRSGELLKFHYGVIDLVIKKNCPKDIAKELRGSLITKF